MDNNSTHSSSTSSTNITKNSSQSSKKPVFVTLQKIGNSFTFVQPITASKIPKLITSSSKLATLQTNKVAPVNQGKNSNQKIPVPAIPYDNDSLQFNATIYQNKLESTNRTDKIIPSIAITTKNATKKSTFSRKTSIAASSITISKQKSTRKTYSKKKPNQLSTTKFNFPPPPPKLEFRVSTLTPFNTATDEPRQIERELPARSCNSLSLDSDFVTDKTDLENTPVPEICDDTNGVPIDCRSFRKLTINTGSNQPKTTVKSIAQDCPKTVRRFSSEELREAIENVGIPYQSQVTPDPVAETIKDSITESDTLQSVTAYHNGFGEIIKRLDRVEALQLVAAKRDTQILVAVKKLCMAYTKYNDDNDEIKKLLPMKNQPDFDAMDIRLTADPALIEKFRAYLRGFKTSNNPDNFGSILSVLMTDELVDSYNYTGILGKLKLQGTKIMDIIHDLHKPMDTKTFAKLIRTTIDLAKNRYHNEQYRKRQLEIRMDTR